MIREVVGRILRHKPKVAAVFASLAVPTVCQVSDLPALGYRLARVAGVTDRNPPLVATSTMTRVVTVRLADQGRRRRLTGTVPAAVAPTASGEVHQHLPFSSTSRKAGDDNARAA